MLPEDGIIFGLRSRKETKQFAEQLSATQKSICTEEFKETHPILHCLACRARQHGIYLVANMIDIQPCAQSKCPSDQKLVYNTAVLIDRNGSLIVKYHKMHPFNEPFLDVPPSEELVVADTEIGRLGMMICFDMIFDTPGTVLT